MTRRVRVTSTMRKALANQRDAKGNVLRGGIMIAPAVLSVEAWDALAGPQQARLIQEARGDVAIETPAPKPSLARGSCPVSAVIR